MAFGGLALSILIAKCWFIRFCRTHNRLIAQMSTHEVFPTFSVTLCLCGEICLLDV